MGIEGAATVAVVENDREAIAIDPADQVHPPR
jgi:hypothetical protein